MVSSRFGNETGKIRLGCLFSILVLVAGAYFGIEFFQMRFRYYRIQDTVKTQVTFASALDDRAILARLVAQSDTLGLPLGPRRWTITRSRIPAENRRLISISAEYTDSVVLDLPGVRKVWTFTFRPGVENHIY